MGSSSRLDQVNGTKPGHDGEGGQDEARRLENNNKRGAKKREEKRTVRGELRKELASNAQLERRRDENIITAPEKQGKSLKGKSRGQKGGRTEISNSKARIDRFGRRNSIEEKMTKMDQKAGEGKRIKCGQPKGRGGAKYR